MAHLSVRTAWHDTDWTGRVCAAPGANHACTILKNVKERKDAAALAQVAGRPWRELPSEQRPPCVFERAGFMRDEAETILRKHAYSRPNSSSHSHFAETAYRMSPYSFEATPYRWVMREEARAYSEEWGIEYDDALEARADELMGWTPNWVQDHRNQLALLDSFFSGVEPGRSLVLVYVKDLPLVEDRAPGFRALVGAGLVESVAPVQEWRYVDGPVPLRSVFWERGVGHTIRPGFGNGFLLPYHALLELPDLVGEDLTPFIARTPDEHFDEFSYVTERVGHDGGIAALAELARVVDLLPGVVDGAWDSVAAWLSDRIADAWELRGPYPGLGAALAAAGLERGGLIAHRVVESLEPGVDPWPHVAEAIASDGGPAAGLIGRMGRKAWERVAGDRERFALLRLIARFPMTSAQARRVFDPVARADAGLSFSDAEALDNPYVLFEADRGRKDALSFRLIDRGLFPRNAAAKAVLDADPLPEPITEASDDRRVRGACTELLEAAAGEGHSLLDEPRLRKRLAQLELDPKCDPASAVFEIAAEEFAPVLVPQPLANGRDRGWQLARLAAASDLISKEISARVERGHLDAAWDWRAEIDAAIEEPVDESDDDEIAARTEKAVALEILARSPVAALVGPAGTGKTTMLRALCSHPDVANRGVLLLAPTGKARVQLGDKVGAPAKTLAQFLRTSGRWHDEFGYRPQPGAPKEAGAATVVVDEASMLTEEMLAALIDALSGVDRLILCGDHRQLPPIGAGRPFVDIVRHLRSLTEQKAGPPSGGAVAELTIGRRQKADAETLAVGRDDLAIASFFSTDGTNPAADEALARVLGGGGDGTIEIRSWEDEDDLHQQVFEFLTTDPTLAIKPGDADDLRRSLGAAGEYNGRPSFVSGEGGIGAERWQILSPLRARAGGVKGLNELIRRKWRAGDLASAIRSYKLPPPLGADQVLFYDKVMCTANHLREAWQVTARQKVKRQPVANGEIGMAVIWQKNKGLKVEFSTQPGLQFTFWASELNAESERSDVLEQAYAITVHKSQGSQFETTLVVIPNPCQLLSPELVYTALTRQRDRVVVFFQGDTSELRHLASPSRSETARRLTRLFRLPDPFETLDGEVVDGAHVHRTLNNELVRSKSEVIVANTLHGLGVAYAYEQQLVMKDGSRRLPDFTLSLPSRAPVYWEHLGMLESAGYRADWEAKLEWYKAHDVLPLDDGGGASGTLVWSTESRKAGIDSLEIEALARRVMEAAGR
jgi:hypothetical protein